MKKKQPDINAEARASLKKLVPVAKPPVEVRVPASRVLAGLKVKLPGAPVIVPRGSPLLPPVKKPVAPKGGQES